MSKILKFVVSLFLMFFYFVFVLGGFVSLVLLTSIYSFISYLINLVWRN